MYKRRLIWGKIKIFSADFRTKKSIEYLEYH